MNGCLPADCDIPKMRKNSYQFATGKDPRMPESSSGIKDASLQSGRLGERKSSPVEREISRSRGNGFTFISKAKRRQENQRRLFGGTRNVVSPMLHFDREAFKRSRKG